MSAAENDSRRILIADDRANARELLRQQLTRAGYLVDEACDGIEALRMARRHPPLAVVSDLLMPRLDGFMLLREWRGDPELFQIPFIVYTATFTEPQDEALVRRLGADDFLVKPAEAAELVRRMEAVIAGTGSETRQLIALADGDEESLRTYNYRLGKKLQHKIDQLQRTRAALRDSNNLHSTLFHNNHLPMLLIDPEDGIIVEANRAAVSFYGWSHTELLRRRIDTINTLGPVAIREEMERASEYQRNHFLFRHRLADGSERDVEVYTGPVRLGDRHLLYSIVNDVTERLEAERRLRRTEDLLRAASTVARVGGWEADLIGGKVYWSDEVCRIHGLPPGTVVSISDGIDFYTPEYRDRIKRLFDACVEEGVPYDVEMQIQRVDGGRRWVRAAGEPTRDEEGRIVGAHGAFQDIEAQVEAQQQLRQLSLAVEQSPEMIVITDLQPRILYVNEAGCRVSGYSREELLGQNPRVLASGRTPRATYAAMWQSLRRGKAWSGTLYNRRKDGAEFIESVTISPVRQDDGRVTHYLAVKQDITAQRETESELRRYRFQLEDLVKLRTAELAEAREQADLANSAKSQFLANMSHEIRTPMNGVLGTVELLEAESLNDYQQELVATIRESGRSLIRIIEDILDFTRIEAGRLSLENEEFSLEESVEGLCDSMTGMAHERGVDLHVFISPDLPNYYNADDVRLRQILYNLVGNAIKFSGGRSDKRGRVLLSVTPAPDQPSVTRFVIRDNGIGISEDARKDLFQPFSQAEEVSKRRFGGSGLGLVICRRLADMMGGEISFESTVGEGSTFMVDLPLAVSETDASSRGGELSGVRCEMIPHRACATDAILAYLGAAGAEAWIAGQNAKDPGDNWSPDVSIRFSDRPVAYLATARDTGASSEIVLSREAGSRPRLIEDGLVVLGSSVVRRRALINAALVALGRKSLEPNGKDGSRRPAGTPAADAEEARRHGRLILVAEDDEINRKVIERQLHLLGYAAEIAKDGSEALEMWKDGGFGMILTDLHMPRMDGYELAAAIRKAEQSTAGSHTPVIALTANALRGEAARAERQGLDGYLTKPLQLDLLRQTLSRWLPAGPESQESNATTSASDETIDEQVLDLDLLKQYIGEDAAFRSEFLVDYLKSAEGLIEDFRRACDASDVRQAAAIAHKLKSSSRTVGAGALGALAERLERAGRDGLTEHVLPAASRLEEEFSKVRAAARDALSSTTA